MRDVTFENCMEQFVEIVQRGYVKTRVLFIFEVCFV